MGVTEDGGGDLMPEYEGDIRVAHDRRATDRMQDWPTLPELYREMRTLNDEINKLNAVLSNGLPKKVNELDAKLTRIADTQNQCVWGRAGAWRFLTGVFAVAGGITVVMNLVGKFAGWW